MIGIAIVLVLIVALIVYVVAVYNELVGLRENVKVLLNSQPPEALVVLITQMARPQ